MIVCAGIVALCRHDAGHVGTVACFIVDGIPRSCVQRTIRIQPRHQNTDTVTVIQIPVSVAVDVIFTTIIDAIQVVVRAGGFTGIHPDFVGQIRVIVVDAGINERDHHFVLAEPAGRNERVPAFCGVNIHILYTRCGVTVADVVATTDVRTFSAGTGCCGLF